MTARILVVDDIPANVKLLEARLTAEYFDVRTAANGMDALRICSGGTCDLVLLDVMMPGLDGFEVCRRLKADSATCHIPVILVTALDQPADRVRGLEAGADDFLTKPVDETALVARVRSLARLKVTIDEIRIRASSSATLGLQQGLPVISSDDGLKGQILLVDDRPGSSERVVAALSPFHAVHVETDPQKALFRGAEAGYELFVISAGLEQFDGLRLCGQLRSLERTRQIPILLLAAEDDRARVLRGLDIGINDYLIRPIDKNELLARVRTQLRQKRYADRLRDMLQESIQLAVIDSLTGLNNRRFLESKLPTMIEAAADADKPASVMILDIDHFKVVNDTFGHDAGDDVLKLFALRVKAVIRNVDLLCRLGGEEFIVVMPDTSLEVAARVGERIRHTISAAMFPIEQGARQIAVTVSIGIADRRNDRLGERLLKRADRALYRSKQEGRNRVSADAA